MRRRAKIRGLQIPEVAPMTRIPLVDPEDAPPGIAALYERFADWDTPIFNVIRVFGNHEKFLAAFLNMFEPLYGPEATLDPRYRELAYLRASQLNSCHY